jgi:hypothetical protein
MAPLRGWAPKGERLRAKVPYGHWKTMTFLTALRSDRIDAPCVYDGPINGAVFTAYVEQLLVPTLRPGDILIMDNLGSHKGPAVRKAISAKPAPSCCSCRPTARTSIRSSRHSQKSNICCERPPSEPPKPLGSGSEPFSTHSPQQNAPTISSTQDMLKLIPSRSSRHARRESRTAAYWPVADRQFFGMQISEADARG